ncbi:uncharacterized protein LOC132698826 [Cylas formicarius]|uniref:uncharacterized protein LOC132698826 n=1 Tax=Cylas formicarius TaxID=197179 RepID=UPI002958C99C|nr:uncharacterized protein LOC132698826 [Cylas formicarius]
MKTVFSLYPLVFVMHCITGGECKLDNVSEDGQYPEDLLNIYANLIRSSNHIHYMVLRYISTDRYNNCDMLLFTLVNYFNRKTYSVENNFFRASANYAELRQNKKKMKSPGNRIFANQANVMIVPDKNIFEQFLHHDQNIGTKAGHLFLVIFCSNNSSAAIEEILEKFWERFGVLNVIIFIDSKIVVYKPFRNTRGHFGKAETYQTAGIQTNTNTIINDVKRLNGYPIRVSMLERQPTALRHLPLGLQGISIYKNKRFFGEDGMILSGLSEIMNFTITFIDDPNAQIYGKVLDNGTATGTLGQILRREIDLQANGRYVEDTGNEDFEFGLQYDRDQMCVVVPKALPFPRWKLALRVFKGKFFLYFFIALALCAYLNYKLTKRYDSIMEIIAVMLSQSSQSVLYQSTSRKIFLLGLMLFILNLSVIYFAHVLYSFSNHTFYPDINTIDELDKSNLTIKSAFNIFSSIPSAVYQRISNEKVVEDAKVDDIYNRLKLVATARNCATTGRFKEIKQLIQTIQRHHEQNLLHVVPECPKSFYLAFIVPKGSPYLSTFNHYLSKFIEAGLVLKWRRDFRIVISSPLNVKDDDLFVFRFEDLTFAFFVILYGHLISLAVFVGEILWAR